MVVGERAHRDDGSARHTRRDAVGLLDGVVMLTNIAGTYMGDPSFDPVLAELHRRRATVFIHPTSPACHECVSMGYPRPMIEFPFDTTRAVTNLALNGAFERYEGIRWIIPHAGGTLPFLSARIAGMSALTGKQPSTIFDPLRGVYYDRAGSTSAQTSRRSTSSPTAPTSCTEATGPSHLRQLWPA